MMRTLGDIVSFLYELVHLKKSTGS